MKKKPKAYLKKLNKDKKFFREETNLKRFGFKVFKLSSRFADHTKFGHIRIRKIDPQAPRGSNVIEEYEYLPGNGRAIEEGFNYKLMSRGGAHVLRNLNNDHIRIIENLDTRKLPTGDTVRMAKIEFFIKELKHIDVDLPENLKGWRTKTDIHTFWPQNWNYQKIEQAVKEATENIIFNERNKFRGLTKDGIEIEFYIDNRTKEIQTAYIYLKN